MVVEVAVDADIHAYIYVFLCVISISICDYCHGCNGSKIYVLGSERMMICIGLWGWGWDLSPDSGGSGGG